MKQLLPFIISAGVFLASLSVAYYFVKYLPEKQAELSYRKSVIDCGERGRAYYESKKDSLGKLEVLNPEFHFNSKTNECLYSGGYLDGSMITRYIIDIDTNTELVTLVSTNSKIMDNQYCSTCVDTTTFFSRKKVLFEETP